MNKPVDKDLNARRSSHATHKSDARQNTITPEDLELLKEGDHRIYDKVYLQWRKPIYNLLHKLTLSEAEALDITQDVFVNLWENRGNIDPAKDIKYYLYLVARQSAIKYFRRQKARVNYFSRSVWDEIDPNSSEDIVIAKEVELLREITLGRMPKQRRRIYELSLKDGMKNDQIAKELNISKETVANQLAMARRDLREVLGLFLILFFH